MLKSIARSFGFISYAEATALANTALADMKKRTFDAEREVKSLRLMADGLADKHLQMHRQLVEAAKGLVHAEEEVKHLKLILVEQMKFKSPVTQVVTDRSPGVTQPAPKSFSMQEYF